MKAKIDPANWFLNGCDDVAVANISRKSPPNLTFRGLELIGHVLAGMQICGASAEVTILAPGHTTDLAAPNGRI